MYDLDKDCRQSFTRIGAAIRKSPQYVKFRVERLQREKVIQAVAIIPLLPANAVQVCCFIKLRGSEIVEEQTLLDFLFKMPESCCVHCCDGQYDILATFFVAEASRLQVIKETLMKQFSCIEELFFNSITANELYTKKYLHSGEQDVLVLKRETGIPDPFAARVLLELQKNPFGNLLELSKALHTTYDKIKYLFSKKTPYQGTRLVLSTRLVKKAVLFLDVIVDMDKIMGFARASPYIIQADSVLGSHGIALYFECLASEELHRYTKAFLCQFTASIRDHVKLNITATTKYRWLS